MLRGMPTQPPATPSGAKRCAARTSSGGRCQRAAVPGLTVCRSHGGATAASVRASKRASVSQQAAQLWGLSSDASGLNVVETLNKLANDKLNDVIALRIKISSEGERKHIGVLKTTDTLVEYDIEGTVQSKSGTQRTVGKTSGVSVWVQELHRAEAELLQVLKLLQEVTGGNEAVDLKRVRMQTARETARILKGYPGISIDQVVQEVAKGA